MVILQTPRLVLRHPEPQDLDALFALYRDPEIRQYFPDGTLTLEETNEELEWFLHGHPKFPQLGLWATVERNYGAFLGRCGLLPWEIEGKHETELAFLIDKNRWGEGLATEAASAIVNYAQSVAAVVPLIADAKNVAARTSADAFEYANRATVQLSQAFQGMAK